MFATPSLQFLLNGISYDLNALWPAEDTAHGGLDGAVRYHAFETWDERREVSFKFVVW
jgi:hypothetical protein